jgi:hypothetical protein
MVNKTTTHFQLSYTPVPVVCEWDEASNILFLKWARGVDVDDGRG